MRRPTARLDAARLRGLALQFTRFIATGVLNTLVGLGVNWLCWRVIGLPTIISNLIGYCFGLCVSFVINRTWTFRSDRSTRSALPRFLLVFGVSYLANLVTLLVLIDFFQQRVEWATVAATVPYTLTFFFGSRWFVFRPSAQADHANPWKTPSKVTP